MQLQQHGVLLLLVLRVLQALLQLPVGEVAVLMQQAWVQLHQQRQQQ
jgi:hypothetical protein